MGRAKVCIFDGWFHYCQLVLRIDGQQEARQSYALQIIYRIGRHIQFRGIIRIQISYLYGEYH